MASSTRKQHMVAVPLPAQGHLNALMRLCKVLASEGGFMVTFVNIDPVHERMEGLKQQQDEEEGGGGGGGGGGGNCKQQEEEEEEEENIRRAHVAIEGLELGSDFRFSNELFLEAQNSIAPHLDLLIHQLNLQGPPVTCLISDVMMTLPTQKIADKFNIPRIVFFPYSASMLLLLNYIIQGQHITIKKVLEAHAEKRHEKKIICEGLMGLPKIHSNEMPSFKHVVDDTIYMWEFLAKTWQEFSHRAKAMVVNSFEELEASAFTTLSSGLSLPIYGIGPLVKPLHKKSTTSLWKEDKACILWLDEQPPLSVLYISFGSITLLSETQFKEIVAGLLSSQQRFLWVLRPDLVATSSNFVLDILSKSCGKGYIVDWAPQLRVLSHPSVGGFLTHCGWNSTIESIAHGVPMLCWPYFADQFLDAKYVVEEWKVGLQFKSSSKEDGSLVEKGEIERVIKTLMEGKEGKVLRKNIIHLNAAGYESLLPGGTSHKDIQTLIKSLM